MLWINNLCKSLRDKAELRCGSSFVVCICHSCYNSVLCSRNLVGFGKICYGFEFGF